MKDVFSASKIKKGNDDEATCPVGYPFVDMLIFVSACKDLVKFFHNHHVVNHACMRRRGPSPYVPSLDLRPLVGGPFKTCVRRCLHQSA